MTKTEVNSIQVPEEFVELCHDWAGNIDCMLRAISSTGNLTLGTKRPYNTDEDRYMTDEEWYCQLFIDLYCDISAITRSIEKQNRQAEFEDFDQLKAFKQWADETSERLAEEYGL